MTLHIIRSLSSGKKHYTVQEKAFIEGIANNTFGLLPQRISVKTDDVGYVFRQKNVLLHVIFGLFPLIYPSALRSYEILKNEKICGYSEYRFGDRATYFYLDEDCYELRGHTNDIFSLLKNNEQIAVFQKEHYSYAEHNKYRILYEENAEPDTALLLMFCIHIDCRYYRNPENGIRLVNREKSWVVNDPFPERAEWTPNAD